MAEAAGRLIAGFDAGQTHTSCRLAWLQPDGRWRAISDGQGPGVSHLAAEGGEQRFAAALSGSLAASRQAAEGQGGLHPTTALAAAAIGASGIEAGSAVQRQGLQLAARCLQLEEAALEVTGDERTALAGAVGREPGVLVISGTGCIAVGQNRLGRTHRCGGWGWLLDGAGSAMDIGRDGLALSLQMADGRLPATPLQQELWRALAVDTPQALKALVVQPGFGAAGFARLAPLVDQRAQAGDPQAMAVVERSADALAAMVQAVAGQLDLPAPAVCAVGGAAVHLVALRERFAAALQRHCPGAHLQQPAGDACAGALNLAAQTAGLRPR
jgi:N-acetylglucosamine kinase-like BadF-type ATPase